MSATFLGSLLKSQLTFFSRIAGIAIVVFGAYILSGKGFSGFHIKQRKPTTFFGAFLFGAVLGISWTPCVGPILVALLLLASTTGSTLTGGILLFVYGLGLGLPLILFSTFVKKGKLWDFVKGKEFTFMLFGKKRTIHSNSLLSGILFIILGILIFTGKLYTFNQYLAGTSFQKIFFNLEEWLLSFIRK